MFIENTKPKTLRKLIQQNYKKVGNLTELECTTKLLKILKLHFKFEEERFQCALGVSTIKKDKITYSMILGYNSFSYLKKAFILLRNEIII